MGRIIKNNKRTNITNKFSKYSHTQLTHLNIVRLAYWLIRLRWYAIIGIAVVYFTSIYVFHFDIKELPIYLIVLILTLLNLASYYFLKHYKNVRLRKTLKILYRSINFQITTDLIILTFLLHYSGGVENPFIIYYIFHMIIGSIILTTRDSIIQTSFALLLVGAMCFLEYFGIIQHFPLEAFISTNMYNNLTYIICTGFIFISTSYFVVYITKTILKESKKHEAAYLKANEKLKQKDKIKNEYVMRITHDTKGHITAIQSCINVLNKELTGPLNPQQQEFVERADKRIHILNNFISDILSNTQKKLQETPNKDYFNFLDTLDKTIKTIEDSAKEKEVEIIRNIDVSVNEIYGEQSSIEEVLLNIIQNAVKYSPSGKKVFINVKDKKNKLLIEVIDEGIGIPKKEIPQIFNEFYRASNVKKQIDGTGLGLAITKQIVESHNGKIWIESEENRGTKISILMKKKDD